MPVDKGRVGLLVAALESGEYKQGKLALHRQDSDGTERWCCLGVGADVARRFGLEVSSTFEAMYGYGDGVINNREVIGGDASYMCQEVADWYGFESKNPVLEIPDGEETRRVSASEWNDGNVLSGSFDSNGHPESVPHSFADIAEGFRRTYLQEAPDGE